MNDYMKLIARAAAKFTGRPAVLSPLLDSYCGWENKKGRFSSEPIKGNLRIILSSSGLSVDELGIDVSLNPQIEHIFKDEKERKTSEGKTVAYEEGSLKICMKHGSKMAGESNYKWSRDCNYEYAISSTLAPLAHHLGVYWTNDDFLVIQARSLESPFIKTAKVEADKKFRLIPIELIDDLEPALNVPFMGQILRQIKRKASDVCAYASGATELPEEKDVLSLLKYVSLIGIEKEAPAELECVAQQIAE